MKSINTLVQDVYEQVKGNGGWDPTVTAFLAEQVSTMAEEKFSKPQKVRDYLSPSSLGSPDCKLWYRVNKPEVAEPLDGEALGTFFYGDMLEALIISLAMASGHTVSGLQQEVDVFGIKGSMDCIIDGWVVDVKSASKFGFEKFRKHELKENDPFGYISQLSTYLLGCKDDHRVTHKTGAAFFVVQKERFKLCLDFYDLTEELKVKEQEIQHKKDVVKGPWPGRSFKDVADGKSGNRKLPTACSYCEYKKDCWPTARRFAYSDGIRYLTKVGKLPRVPEITR